MEIIYVNEDKRPAQGDQKICKDGRRFVRLRYYTWEAGRCYEVVSNGRPVFDWEIAPSPETLQHIELRLTQWAQHIIQVTTKREVYFWIARHRVVRHRLSELAPVNAGSFRSYRVCIDLDGESDEPEHRELDTRSLEIPVREETREVVERVLRAHGLQCEDIR